MEIVPFGELRACITSTSNIEATAPHFVDCMRSGTAGSKLH